MAITKEQIIQNCKDIHLRNVKLYFETDDFRRWVNKCIDLARENNNLMG